MARFATTPDRRRGDSLVLAIFFVAVVAIFLSAVFGVTSTNLRTTSQRVNTQAAVRLAEAGIEKAVWCLNNPGNTTNCPGNPNYTGETNVSLGAGTFNVSVSGSGNSRTVTATGALVGSGGTVSKDLDVKLVTSNADVSFQYGVQAGIGGIDLSNNAHIQGNVFSSGSVTGSNGSYITGDAVLTVSDPTPNAVSNPSVSPLQTTNIGDASSTSYLVQSFVAGVTDKIYGLDLKIAKHGAPTSNVTAYIYDDNAGTPGENLSGAGQQLTVSVPNDSPAGWENGWTGQIFNPATTLVSGAPYWLVLKASSSNATKYWTLVQGDDATYASGTAKTGSTLSGLTPACSGGCDVAFRINVGGVAPTLNLPSVQGNGYARTINSTTLGKKAYYQNLAGTVKANGGSDTCAVASNGPNCFGNQPDQTPQNFPLSEAQVTQMEGQAAAGGTVTCSPTCTIPVGSSIGPKKYVGDITLSGNGTITLTGTVWATGKITISNDTVLQLSSAYGTNSGTIVADDPANRDTKGLIELSNNGDLAGNGNAGTYIMAIGMNADSAFNTTAINVSNNLSAGVLYAPFGRVDIGNNAQLKEVTAQRLTVSNNASVTYESGLASVIFSSGPGGSWTIQKGTYKIE